MDARSLYQSGGMAMQFFSGRGTGCGFNSQGIPRAARDEAYMATVVPPWWPFFGNNQPLTRT